MGRRDRDTEELEIAKSEPSRAWETVRRTLARLFATASVQNISASQWMPSIALRSSEALETPALLPGSQERTWPPESQVRQGIAPQAQIGGGNGSLLPTVQMAAQNAALAPPECRTMPTVQGAACRVDNADLLLPGFVIHLPEAFLNLPSVPARVEPVTLLTASSRTKKMEDWRLGTPKTRVLRLPRVAPPRVIWGGDDVLSRMALTRRCREAPPNVPFILAFPAEEKRLAEAMHLAPGDVTLLGVYPGVPLLAVSRIVVAEEGRSLLLWLKPEVLRGRNAPRLITLLVGRQVSSGKILQAVL